MFNSERFDHLPEDQKNSCQQRVHQFWAAKTPLANLSQEELSACIWAGEIMLHKSHHDPPASFAELQAFVDLHTWLTRLKHEWLNHRRMDQRES